MDPTETALAFISSVAEAVHRVKPEATPYEIVGTIYLILNRTIETQLNEDRRSGEQHQQLPKSSEGQSGTGTSGESRQVQEPRQTRWIRQGEEGVRKESTSTTTRGRKKRR